MKRPFSHIRPIFHALSCRKAERTITRTMSKSHTDSAGTRSSTLVVAAIQRAVFPTPLVLPENQKQRNPISLFECIPYFVWVPEVICGKKCFNCEGTVLRVLGYYSREVHDIDHATIIHFGRYQCTKCKQNISTVSDDYLNKLPFSVQDAFPYVLTHRSGRQKYTTLLF